MTTHTLLFVIGGFLLWGGQFVVGIALGLWVRESAGRGHHHDLMQASLIAKRLKTLADEMASSAQEHRSKLDEASKLLTSGDAGKDQVMTELVVDVVGEVVRANQQLQVKLDTAENRLQEQAVEIEAHISRSLTDALPGLPNRREFNTRLEERMAAWNRRREGFSPFLILVHPFQKANDRFRQLAGDHAPATVSRADR